MKRIIFGASMLMFACVASAQDLPPNPEPGKCYVRCVTPEVWKNEEVTIEVAPAYKKIVTHPAEYKTVTEKILVKEAGKKLKIVPAVWETKEFTYTAKEDANKLKVVPATFLKDSKTIETKAASAKWVMNRRAPGCESSNPDDCRYWCYKEIPAIFETIPLIKLDKDAYTESEPVPGVTKTYKRQVMVTPPRTEEIEVPAVYKEVKKVVLVKDAWEEEVVVPAETKTITKQVIVSKGGLTTWKEVDCKLTDENVLPINWNVGSWSITPKAKRIIDSKLLPILKRGLSVVIESHTDSRGSDEFNKELSEKRAKAVVNYLISRGVNPSQLTGNGLGETRLLNRCSNGVPCTDQEHRVNRRTTFRIVNQK